MCFMHVFYPEKTVRIGWKVQEHTPGSLATPLVDISMVEKPRCPGPSPAHPAVTAKVKEQEGMAAPSLHKPKLNCSKYRVQSTAER